MSIVEAARALLEKLDAIEAHGGALNAFNIAAIHGCPYTGPQYGEDMEALRTAIDAAEPTREAVRSKIIEIVLPRVEYNGAMSLDIADALIAAGLAVKP